MSRILKIEIGDTEYALLQVLTYTGALDGHRATVEQVVRQLIDHAQQGVYRPGAWERGWLEQVFGKQWQSQLEPGDPYGRPNSPMSAALPRSASAFQRPKT